MGKYSFDIWGIFPFFLILFILFLILKSNKKEKMKCWYCFVVIFLFAAVRYGIGYDYYNYRNYVLGLIPDYSYEGLEPLSRVLTDIAAFTHYQVFFVLGSFLTLFPVYLTCIKLSINPAYSLLIFFLHPSFYLNDLCIVRNAIAFSFVLYATTLLIERKMYFSFAFVVMAYLFHRSGAIGILIYPIYYIRSSRNVYLALYIISFSISLLVARVLGAYTGETDLFVKASGYAQLEGVQGGGSMTIIINGLCILNFITWKKLTLLGCNNAFFLKLFTFGTCVWNVFLSVNPTMAVRLSIFFLQIIILIVVYYRYLLGAQYFKFANRMTTAFFLTLFLSYFYINVSAYLKDSSERMSNIPYQTIFYKEDYSNYVN